jgi:hypothetical protein
MQWSLSRMLLVTLLFSVFCAIASRPSPLRIGFIWFWSNVGEMFGFYQGLDVDRSLQLEFGVAAGFVAGLVSMVVLILVACVLLVVAWILTEKKAASSE